MRRELKPHQARGRDFLFACEGGRALLWRMGAGKTASVLAALYKVFAVSPYTATALIVAPRIVCDTTWATEPVEWPQFPITLTRLEGNAARRLAILKTKPRVLLAHYEQLDWLRRELKAGVYAQPTFAVFDEASALRNATSVRWRAAIALSADTRRRWLLTGTPLNTGGWIKVWALMAIMDFGKRWGRSFRTWRDANFTPDARGWNWFPLPGRHEQFQADLASVSSSLTEADYPQVPVRLVRRRINLPENARQIYADARANLASALKEELNVEISPRLRSLAGVLQQIASGAIYQGAGLDTWSLVHAAKLDALDEILPEVGNSIVFIQYRHELARLRERYSELPALVGGVSAREAADIVTRWNAGEIELMAAHPSVGGFGLNLQAGGSSVIWFSLPWNVEHFSQANAPVARPGQVNTVTISVLEAANTIDGVMLKALDGRIGLERRVLEEIAAREPRPARPAKVLDLL